MARRSKVGGGGKESEADLTPLIDVCFQLITFFVMLMTLAKDEAAQKIKLPVAASAQVLTDDQIPDSINVNVDSRGHLLGWGLDLDLSKSDAKGWTEFGKLIRKEGLLQKESQKARGVDWKKEGLSTTVIVRVDREVEYEIFRRVMDMCRAAGFSKFQLKAAEEEEA
ncbi:biopolymer transport protein ExbD [Planctomycetes bacterium Pan216]|uniref:Biopolymer transport protein ExbD n=1 Tax=Kolteria novifilia TaxID=2527975 RepID=A0A518AY51_9BACT|nr:biopolymer transport protein ExbD [Planctomycetes bacterium Pan216]